MSDPEARDAPPEEPESKAAQMDEINDESRRVPTRPGWKAGLAVLAFLGAFAVYISYI